MSESKLEGSLKLPDGITAIDFSKGDETVLFGLLDESIQLSKFPAIAIDPTRILKEETFGIYDAKFSPNNQYVGASCMDACLRIWETSNNKLRTEIVCEPTTNFRLFWSPTNSQIYTAGEKGRIRGYETLTGSMSFESICGEDFITAFSLAPNGLMAVAGNCAGKAFLFKPSTKESPVPIDFGCRKKIRDASFMAGGTRILFASDDLIISLVDVETKKVLSRFNGHVGPINAVDAHPTNETAFISCSFDKTVKVWSVLDKKEEVASNQPAPKESVLCCKYSKSGNHFACGTEEGNAFVFKA